VDWVAFLLVVAAFLGLRDRVWKGSTHVTLLVVTCLTLAYAFLRLGR
jgi:hypothetical protein